MPKIKHTPRKKQSDFPVGTKGGRFSSTGKYYPWAAIQAYNAKRAKARLESAMGGMYIIIYVLCTCLNIM